MKSFRSISSLMDPVDPPTSLTSLIQKHRDNNNSNSLRKVWERHNNPNTVQIRFLSYNTFLMQLDVQPILDFIDNYIDPEIYLDWFGINPKTALTKVLDSLNISKVCDLFFPSTDVPVVSDVPGLGDVVKGTINPLNGMCKLTGSSMEIASFLLKNLSLNPIQILKKVGINVRQILSLFGLGFSVTVMKKPALTARSHEIGRELAKNYDLSVLSEMWTETVRKNIVNKWKIPPHTSIGPNDRGQWKMMGSGLMVVSSKFKIKKTAQHIFQNDGIPPGNSGHRSRMVDSDTWANKGVLLTKIPIPKTGIIEIYNTHLYSGGDMLPNVGVMKPPSESYKNKIRNLQVEELIRFYKKYHNPKNVAIITGDFNIKSHDKKNYKRLISHMNSINMQDLWVLQYGNDGGSTAGSDPTFKDHGDLSSVCKLDSKGKYCKDPQVEKPSVKRIDYLFIEHPRTSHTFNLDVSRILRHPFVRKNPTEERNYLSDHIGLDVTLIPSPK